MFVPKNAKDLASPWTAWFLYGPSGSGKTTIASSFPRPLFLVPKNERSITSLMGSDTPYVEITGVDDPIRNGEGGMQPFIDALVIQYKKDPNAFPYDTIVVESLSHYSDIALEHYEKKGKGQQVWGMLANHFRSIHNALRSMDVHVIYTALSQVDAREDVSVGSAMLSGKMGFKLPAACDVFGYCEAGTGKTPVYRVHFEKYKIFDARTRFKRMPRMVENMTWEKVEKFCTT